MLRWTLAQWLSEPGRAALGALVYGSVLALSLLFDGLWVGILTDLKAFPASLPADLVAIETGNTNFSLSPSNLPQQARRHVEAVDGVTDVQPILLIPFIFTTDDLRTPAILFAYDQAGGPTDLAAGRAPTPEREIVIDARLAQRHGVKIGDKAAVFDDDLTVVGLSRGTNSPFTPYTFITYDRFIDVALASELPFGTGEFSLVSGLLVRLASDADPAAARRALEAAVPDADFYTPAELGQADADYGARLLGPILLLIIAIAWLITVLTMGILRYADVQSHLREFGVQKAIGATPAGLGLALLLGGVWIALAAFPVAIGISHFFAWITAVWNPLYNARVGDPGVLARGAAMALGASAAGGLMALPRLIRLDPVMVFQK